MITCPICDNIYSEKRSHCPACGFMQRMSKFLRASGPSPFLRALLPKTIAQYGPYAIVAIGAERARQLPQSPRKFELVD